MDILDLDNAQIYRETDSQGIFRYLREFPDQCRRAWETAAAFRLPAHYAEIDRVAILGMGGSAIGGDLFASLALHEAGTPISVVRDYTLPAYVDKRTLVIASSYSGNTEEVLSAFQQALKTDCQKLAITTGGKLKQIAGEAGIPTFAFSFPAQPRAALPFSLLPLLRFLQDLGILKDKSHDVQEAISILKKLVDELNEGVPESRNPAKQLTRRLCGRLPVIYGAGILTEVARRWKTQINENAKAWAFYEVLPELNHNAVVGYQFPPDQADRLAVIILRSALLGDRVRLRQHITSRLLESAGVKYYYVDSTGERALSQVLSSVIFGDYVSCYLAMLYKIDPSPVPVIDFLKKELASH